MCAVVALAGFGVRLLSAADPSRRPGQNEPGTVLLVPGYGGNGSSLGALADRLRGTGREVRVVELPDSGTGDLVAQADALDTAVRRALGGGAPSVDVVGYSAGGVVARLWVDRHDGAAVARRVVSLGSPLHGARIAGVGAALAPDACPPACRQLAPGSDLLSDLERSALPAGLPWLSIWTEDDETVQPPDSARLAGAVNVAMQSICPGARISHGGLPTDPLVTALVLGAVGATPLSAPTGCPG